MLYKVLFYVMALLGLTAWAVRCKAGRNGGSSGRISNPSGRTCASVLRKPMSW